MLSEKSRPKDNGEVLHRHRVFCRVLVYPGKNKLKHVLPKDTDRGDFTDAGDP